eukprot:scaffold15140_cov164-Cylindrotheca_fusiformis.AAC.4
MQVQEQAQQKKRRRRPSTAKSAADDHHYIGGVFRIHSKNNTNSKHRKSRQLLWICTFAAAWGYSYALRKWMLQALVHQTEYHHRRHSMSSSSSDTPPSLSAEAIGGGRGTLNLIPNHKLQPMDYFSDSFLLSKQNFLNMDTKKIGIVEDACFVAAGNKHSIYPRSKMFVDWTDFMVEHMSKWWRSFFIAEDKNPAMFQKTISMLQRYLEKCQLFMNEQQHPQQQQETYLRNSPLHPTIALIAFAPYKSSLGDRSFVLTAHSLAATIASLCKVGFGRVVVVGSNNDDGNDSMYVNEALRLLLFEQQHNSTKTNSTCTSSEISYVHITNKTWLQTKWVALNIPRAAVVGLQLALTGQLKDNEAEIDSWLGASYDRSYWKYVYLTEPDTILHTKPWLLEPIRDGLNHGLSFFPHRLLPLPHESDLPSPPSGDDKNGHRTAPYAGHFIPNTHPFSNITTIKATDGEYVCCCDDGNVLTSHGHKFDDCGRWWLCGFDPHVIQTSLNETEVRKRHERLLPYPLMRLEDGIGMVFGSSERGRRCIPSKSSSSSTCCADGVSRSDLPPHW